jgi:glycosyltransferase involved in cell wall biosynthesis
LNGFENIVIFSENNKGKSRINISGFEFHLIISINWKSRISAFFKKEFYHELNYLNKKGKLNISTFRTAWYSMSKALSIAQQLESTIEIDKAIFYSYWLDEKAIALALLKKKYQNLKAISRAHGWDVYDERHPNLYLPYRQLLLDRLDSVFTISNNGKDYLTSKYPGKTRNLKLSRLGTIPLQEIPQKRNCECYQIISISSIIPLKRVDKILNLISSIKSINKVHWTHIGDGPDFEKIKKIALEKSKMNSNFSFKMVGQLPNSELRDLLTNEYFDLFLNLSETEGIPVTIMEAQSAGIPVLATNVGGTSEIVNNHNGFLVEKDFNFQSALTIIGNFLSSDETKKQQKRNASFENWRQYYNAISNYGQFVEILTKLKSHSS